MISSTATWVLVSITTASGPSINDKQHHTCAHANTKTQSCTQMHTKAPVHMEAQRPNSVHKRIQRLQGYAYKYYVFASVSGSQQVMLEVGPRGEYGCCKDGNGVGSVFV